MAYTIMGNNPITRAGSRPAGNTYIEKLVVSPGRGILKQVLVYIATTGGTLKIKIFRDDGSNYLFRGESSVTVAAGLNTVSVWIPVEKGDLIGFYSSAATPAADSSGGSDAYKSGDITSDSLKTTWTATVNLSSIQGNVFALGRMV